MIGGIGCTLVIHTVEVDTIVIGSCWDTHHVDLVRVDNFRPLADRPRRVPRNAGRNQNPFRWRAVPGSGRTATRTIRAFWCGDPIASFSHVWSWPGWDNSRVTWLLGRPFPDLRHARSGR